MDFQAPNNQNFTGEQIKNFAGFYNSLKTVHNRLVSEGYIIKNGELIPPNKNKIYEQQ
jgi:hypothetical protein